METVTTELVETGEKRDRPSRRIALELERMNWIERYERSGLTHRAFVETLQDWSEEIARMWRFARNGITESFHREMTLATPCIWLS
jgi:hypothetical protein